MRRAVIVLSLVVAASIAACATTTDHPAPAGDPIRPPVPEASPVSDDDGGDAEAGVDAGDAGDLDSGPGACSGLFATKFIDETRGPATAPAPTGGTVMDGTYDLVSVIDYGNPSGGPTGRSYNSTLRITGNKIDRSQKVNFNGAPLAELDISGTFTTMMTTMSVDETCPTPGPFGVSYSVDGTSLEIGYPDPQIFRYTKR